MKCRRSMSIFVASAMAASLFAAVPAAAENGAEPVITESSYATVDEWKDSLSGTELKEVGWNGLLSVTVPTQTPTAAPTAVPTAAPTAKPSTETEGYSLFYGFDDGNADGWTGGTLEDGAYKLTGGGTKATLTYPECSSGVWESSVDLSFDGVTGASGTEGNLFLNIGWTSANGIDASGRGGYRFKYDDGVFDVQEHDTWTGRDVNLAMDGWYTMSAVMDIDNNSMTITLTRRGEDEILASYSKYMSTSYAKLDMWVRCADDGYILLDNFTLSEVVPVPEQYSFTEDFTNALVSGGTALEPGWSFSQQSGPVDYNGDTVQVIGANGNSRLEYYGTKAAAGSFTGQVDVCFDEGYGDAAIPTESCNLADIKFGSGNNSGARGAYFKYDADSDSITVLCQPEWGYNFYTGLDFGTWYTVRIDANLDIDLAKVSIIDRESGALIAEHETTFPDDVSYAWLQGLRNNLVMIDNFMFASDPEPDYEDILHGYAPEDGVSHQNAAMKAYMADSYDSIASYAKGDAVRDYAVPVTFHWDAADAGTVYTFEISKNSDMSEARAYETSRDYYDIYNLKLGTTYYWRALGSTNEAVSSFTTSSAAPRIMYASGVKNFRDLGGRTTADGKTVSQGKVYRSYCLDYYNSDTGEHAAYINDSGIDTMVNELGIKTEIDLRSESSQKESILGSGVNFYLRGMTYSGDIITGERSMIRSIFAIFADKNNYPIDFHCQIGTDRTGTIAYLLNGLLGVPKEELMRDYLFSNFCNIGQRLPEAIAEKYVKTLDEYEGGTLQEKIYNWLNKEAGVTAAELDFIIAYLTGDEEAESPEFTYDVYQTFDDGNASGWTGGTIENGAYKLTGNGKRVSYTLPDTIKSGKVESSVDLSFNNITGNGGDNVFLNMAWCESSVDQNPRKGWRFKYDSGNFDLQGHDQANWAVYDLNLPMDKTYTAIYEIDFDKNTYTIRLRYKDSSQDLYSYSGAWNGEFGKLDMWVRIPDTDGYILLDNFRISKGDEEQIPLPENANEIGLTVSDGKLIANGYFDGAELTGKSYRVIFSEYSEDGQLIRVELSDAYTVTEGQNVFEYSTDMTNDMENVKAFVWADGMIPICPAKGI